MKKLIVIAAVILGFTSATFAQTVTSKAVIVGTLSITTSNNIDFGSLLSAPAAGTAVMAASSAGTMSGTIATTTGVTPTAAKFVIAGAGGSPILTFPSSITLTGPGANMTLTPNCRIDGSNTDLVSGSTAIALTAGSATVYMGGTLAVGANQKLGTYTSAALPVTVNY
jgi:hypothetical protein